MKYLGCRHITLARADKLIAKACVAILQGETITREKNACVCFFDWRSSIAVVGFRVINNTNTNHHSRYLKKRLFDSIKAVRVLDKRAVSKYIHK